MASSTRASGVTIDIGRLHPPHPYLGVAIMPEFVPSQNYRDRSSIPRQFKPSDLLIVAAIMTLGEFPNDALPPEGNYTPRE
jgi:hypothetical protein